VKQINFQTVPLPTIAKPTVSSRAQIVLVHAPAKWPRVATQTLTVFLWPHRLSLTPNKKKTRKKRGKKQ
jgi:hypothetical protein